MRKLLFAFTAVVLVLSACQKEASLENTNSTPGTGGGSTNAGLLARMVFAAASGNDSTVYTFSYDGSKRLTLVNYTAANFVDQVRFQRNAAGIITQTIIKNPAITSFGLDSLVIRYNYSTAESRYKSAIFTAPIPNVPGGMYMDSTAFNYDGGGNMTNKISYIGLVGGQLAPAAKIEYTYAGANLTSAKSYGYDNGNWDLEYTFNFSYDTRENPLRLGVEAVLVDPYASPAFGLNSAIYYGPNNATVIDYVDGADPADNFKVTSAFTYNTASKPSGGTAVQTPGNQNYVWRFYYY